MPQQVPDSKHGITVDTGGFCPCCDRPINWIIDHQGNQVAVDRPVDTLHSCEQEEE